MPEGAARPCRGARRRTTPVAPVPRPGAAPRGLPASPARAPAAPATARGTAPPTRARRRRIRGSRRSRPLLLQLLELLPGTRVDDVGLRHPTAASLRHRELEVRLRANLVAVRGDDELQAGLLRRARVDVAQVEAVRLAVDLEERACLERPLEHPLEGALAVCRPVRVRVQVAADVAQLDELRKLPAPRGLQLAGVLAQLRRDRLVAEELVHRVLVGAAEDVAGLDRRDAVLRDREPPPHGLLA